MTRSTALLFAIMYTSSQQESLSLLYLEVSTVHGQTVENNGLTAYGRLSWTVHILGRQRFVNGLSTGFQRFVNGLSTVCQRFVNGLSLHSYGKLFL